jgi:hypothetical protein
MTTGRIGQTATRLANGKVLIAGGEDASFSATASAELYDPSSGTFSATGSMTVPRAFHTATLLPNGKVLIVGGWQFNFPSSALASAELYDPISGTFSPTGSMSTGRVDQTATLLGNGEVLVVGGFGNLQLGLASAELYDPSAGTFSPTGSMVEGVATRRQLSWATAKSLLQVGTLASLAQGFRPPNSTTQARGRSRPRGAWPLSEVTTPPHCSRAGRY